MAAREKETQLKVAEPEQFESITVTPITPRLGAEVGGVSLAESPSELQLAEIRRAFARYHVLVFREQALDLESHKRFGRLFGELHIHPTRAHPQAAKLPSADKEIVVVKADHESRYVAGEEWHTDVSCDAEPPMGSMLYLTETPEIGCGGDTVFIDTIHAFEALSPSLQEYLKTLTAVHDGAKPYTDGYGASTPPGGWPSNTHPVVVRHPRTGDLSLYVNRGFTTAINELNRSESNALLELLWRHIESNLEFQCRVRWTPNTLTFWDNIATQHHSVWDYYPYGRFGQRVTITGEKLRGAT